MSGARSGVNKRSLWDPPPAPSMLTKTPSGCSLVPSLPDVFQGTRETGTQRTPDERLRLSWTWWPRKARKQGKSSNEEPFEILPVGRQLQSGSSHLSCTNGEQDVEQAEEATGGRHQSEEARFHQGTAGRETLLCVQEFKASDTKLQSQERIAQLQQENGELKHRLELAQQKIKRLEEENAKLKSSVLVKKGEVEGSFVSSDETPAAIAEDYDKLFGQGRRNLVKDTRTDELAGKLLANRMFKIAYEECRRAVAHEMFEELFCHRVSDTEQSSPSRTKLKELHGQLLHLKKPCIHAKVEPTSLASKVVRDLSSDPAVSSSNLQGDPKYAFALGAVELALRMVMIQPPMVIDYPETFSEDVQDKYSSQWCDEYGDEADLVYLKPVLYSSGERSMPIRKGLVGNKRITLLVQR